MELGHGEERHAAAHGHVQRKRRGCGQVKTDVMLPHQDAAHARVSHQGVVTGQFVIQPQPHEPDAQNQRCLDGAQRLVEVGRLLIGNFMDNGRVEPRSCLAVQTVHISHDSLRHQPHFQGIARRAVAGHQIRRAREQIGNTGP